MLYFDNGVNERAYDSIKLRLAAYYYNRIPEGSLSTKDIVYLAGSIPDFEKAAREPRWIYPGAWQVDDSIGTTWGYTDGMKYRSAAAIIQELVDIASKGGNLLLNISPKGDGSIPREQQVILKQIGAWLKVNGEAINGSTPLRVYGEGPSVPKDAPPDWRGGSTAQPTPMPPKRMPTYTAQDVRYTKNNGALYVTGMAPAATASLNELSSTKTQVNRVTLLATDQPLTFQQTPEALTINLGPNVPAPYVLKIEGTQNLSA